MFIVFGVFQLKKIYSLLLKSFRFQFIFFFAKNEPRVNGLTIIGECSLLLLFEHQAQHIFLQIISLKTFFSFLPHAAFRNTEISS